MTNNLSSRAKTKQLIFGAVGIILLTFIDQFTKYLVVERLKGKESFVIIKGVFELTYLENIGSAFGMMEGQKWLFVILTTLFLIVIMLIYYRIPNEKRFRLIRIVAVILGAGAIGNLIDRIRLDYVVDFLYFSLIDFPVFNVADCYVVVSALSLIFLVFFYYKDDEWGFLSLKKVKPSETDRSTSGKDDGANGGA